MTWEKVQKKEIAEFKIAKEKQWQQNNTSITCHMRIPFLFNSSCKSSVDALLCDFLLPLTLILEMLLKNVFLNLLAWRVFCLLSIRLKTNRQKSIIERSERKTDDGKGETLIASTIKSKTVNGTGKQKKRTRVLRNKEKIQKSIRKNKDKKQRRWSSTLLSPSPLSRACSSLRLCSLALIFDLLTTRSLLLFVIHAWLLLLQSLSPSFFLFFP